ncbi:uncharacterized protein JCM6883_001951 [Sporobolomyces salmoneus]|uniref:uncharacterized protein n=1 Tax=Sporobolomyces salmoneus TaxID=183962 RepID=UPI00316EBD12
MSSSRSPPVAFRPVSRQPIITLASTLKKLDELSKRTSPSKSNSVASLRTRLKSATQYINSDTVKVEEPFTKEGLEAIYNHVEAILNSTPQGEYVQPDQVPTLYYLIRLAIGPKRPWSVPMPRETLDAALKDLGGPRLCDPSVTRLRKELKEGNNFYDKWDEYEPWKQLECVGYIYGGTQSINEVKRKLDSEGRKAWNQYSEATKQMRGACNLTKIVEWKGDPEPFEQLIASSPVEHELNASFPPPSITSRPPCKMILDNVLQPSIISLFSSTSSHPLILASEIRTSSTNTDSFIALIDDTAKSEGEEKLISFNSASSSIAQPSQAIRGTPEDNKRDIRSRVLHLQDPDCRSTSVRWGSLTKEISKESLGIQLEYVHLQVKNLGQDFYFDVAIVDEKREVFVFRCSTFQSKAKVYPATDTQPTLLHLPLVFPPSSSTLLTSWTTITLPLSALLSSIPSHGGPTPARFSSLLGIEIHANCRLRRIWFSNDGKDVEERSLSRGMMSELALYAAVDEQ